MIQCNKAVIYLKKKLSDLFLRLLSTLVFPLGTMVNVNLKSAEDSRLHQVDWPLLFPTPLIGLYQRVYNGLRRERPGFESQACHLLTCDLVQVTKLLLSHFLTCKMCTIPFKN